MNSGENIILKEFADKIRRSYPNARISLFGSYANGTATTESDMDVCVVLPELSTHDRFAVSDIAWEVSLSHDVHISTLVFSKNDIEIGAVSASPLVDSIRNQGVAV